MLYTCTDRMLTGAMLVTDNDKMEIRLSRLGDWFNAVAARDISQGEKVDYDPGANTDDILVKAKLTGHGIEINDYSLT